MNKSVLFALAAFLMLAAGCRSPYVQATVTNSGAGDLHAIEVDYPSASFGLPSLAPGESFHYRFQLRDTGRIKVQFLDNAGRSHSGTGPYAAEGQQGTLLVTLNGNGKIAWDAKLHPAVPTPNGE